MIPDLNKVTIWAGGFAQKIIKQYILRIVVREISTGYYRSLGRNT